MLKLMCVGGELMLKKVKMFRFGESDFGELRFGELRGSLLYNCLCDQKFAFVFVEEDCDGRVI